MTLKICVESLPSLASPLPASIQTIPWSSVGAREEVVVGVGVAVVVDDGAGVDAAEQATFPDTQSSWPSTSKSEQD